MTTTLSSMRVCADTRFEERPLPAHPFVAVRYHFGMLLGVEDFEAEQAYHRGKNRLHNAWLHRDGVVWGLEVRAPRVEGRYRDEIEVMPGLALDLAGNELHLDAPHCLDLHDWYEQKKRERLLDEDDEEARADGRWVKVTAYVAARYESCLMRPVPAMMEPCNGMGDDTAYSRASETIELRLIPGAIPEAPREPYHRLRLLFGLDSVEFDGANPADTDQRVLDLLDEIEAAGSAAARRDAVLAAFRECAALDVIELRPGSTLDGALPSGRYPADDRPAIVLARIALWLHRPAPNDRWRIDGDPPAIDNTVRPAHVATRTIQELLCGSLLEGDPTRPPTMPSAPRGVRRRAEARAGAGPQVDPGTLRLEGNTLRFDVTVPLAASSVTAEAVEVHAFVPDDGWVPRRIRRVAYDDATRRVTVTLGAGAAGDLLRVVVRGTGPKPILGSNLIPLAGAHGEPAASRHEGRDFTSMLRPRS